jgi:hypothetical protein
MPPGHAVPFIRRALALALAVAERQLTVALIDPRAAPPALVVAAVEDEAEDEVLRLRTIIAATAFEPLPDGIRSRSDALHVMGFPPGAKPDIRTLRAKFRLLATIHHPDNDLGSHQRMSQLNQAMQILREG